MPRKKIQCLGHVISKKGIAVDAQKIKVIWECPMPKDVADIQYFMGLVRYYRRFIQGFSRIDYFITSLQRKGVNFVWYVKCLESFENLKILLTMAMILKVVDPYKYYTVCIDASKQGLGGVLSQGHMKNMDNI